MAAAASAKSTSLYLPLVTLAEERIKESQKSREALRTTHKEQRDRLIQEIKNDYPAKPDYGVARATTGEVLARYGKKEGEVDVVLAGEALETLRLRDINRVKELARQPSTAEVTTTTKGKTTSSQLATDRDEAIFKSIVETTYDTSSKLISDDKSVAAFLKFPTIEQNLRKTVTPGILDAIDEEARSDIKNMSNISKMAAYLDKATYPNGIDPVQRAEIKPNPAGMIPDASEFEFYVAVKDVWSEDERIVNELRRATVPNTLAGALRPIIDQAMYNRITPDPADTKHKQRVFEFLLLLSASDEMYAREGQSRRNNALERVKRKREDDELAERDRLEREFERRNAQIRTRWSIEEKFTVNDETGVGGVVIGPMKEKPVPVEKPLVHRESTETRVAKMREQEWDLADEKLQATSELELEAESDSLFELISRKDGILERDLSGIQKDIDVNDLDAAFLSLGAVDSDVKILKERIGNHETSIAAVQAALKIPASVNEKLARGRTMLQEIEQHLKTMQSKYTNARRSKPTQDVQRTRTIGSEQDALQRSIGRRATENDEAAKSLRLEVSAKLKSLRTTEAKIAALIDEAGVERRTASTDFYSSNPSKIDLRTSYAKLMNANALLTSFTDEVATLRAIYSKQVESLSTEIRELERDRDTFTEKTTIYIPLPLTTGEYISNARADILAFTHSASELTTAYAASLKAHEELAAKINANDDKLHAKFETAAIKHLADARSERSTTYSKLDDINESIASARRTLAVTADLADAPLDTIKRDIDIIGTNIKSLSDTISAQHTREAADMIQQTKDELLSFNRDLETRGQQGYSGLIGNLDEAKITRRTTRAKVVEVLDDVVVLQRQYADFERKATDARITRETALKQPAVALVASLPPAKVVTEPKPADVPVKELPPAEVIKVVEVPVTDDIDLKTIEDIRRSIDEVSPKVTALNTQVNSLRALTDATKPNSTSKAKKADIRTAIAEALQAQKNLEPDSLLLDSKKSILTEITARSEVVNTVAAAENDILAIEKLLSDINKLGTALNDWNSQYSVSKRKGEGGGGAPPGKRAKLPPSKPSGLTRADQLDAASNPFVLADESDLSKSGSYDDDEIIPMEDSGTHASASKQSTMTSRSKLPAAATPGTLIPRSSPRTQPTVANTLIQRKKV